MLSKDDMKNIVKTLKSKRSKALKLANWTDKKLQKCPNHIGYIVEFNNHLTMASVYSEILDMLEKK